MNTLLRRELSNAAVQGLGLVAKLDPPDLETRTTILRKRLCQDDVGVVDPSAVERIAERVDTNVRTLEGAFIRSVAFASLTARSRRRGPRRPLPRSATEAALRAPDPGAGS